MAQLAFGLLSLFTFYKAFSQLSAAATRGEKDECQDSWWNVHIEQASDVTCWGETVLVLCRAHLTAQESDFLGDPASPPHGGALSRQASPAPLSATPGPWPQSPPSASHVNPGFSASWSWVWGRDRGPGKRGIPFDSGHRVGPSGHSSLQDLDIPPSYPSPALISLRSPPPSTPKHTQVTPSNHLSCFPLS